MTAGETNTRPTMHERIDHDFAFHPATPTTGLVHAAVRDLFRLVAHEIANNTPAGREQSLALTKLEESMMWANAAIARGTPQLITAPDGQHMSTT